MIADLYEGRALVYALDATNLFTSDEHAPEVIVRGGKCYVLRGVYHNDHANRYQLRYELSNLRHVE